MEQAPSKIKKQKQIFHHGKNHQMKWKDIKHIQFEDDDVIHSSWVDDDNFDYGGYWHGEITRMVEETDEEYQNRLADIARSDKQLREMRYQSYLKLKKEFEND